MTTFTFFVAFALFVLQVSQVSVAGSPALHMKLLAKKLNDNADDIVAKHNVEAMTLEMKKDIEKLLKTSEKNERLCGPNVYQLLENITKEFKLEAGRCVAKMGVFLMNSIDPLNKFDLCISRAENKVSLAGRDIVYSLNQCIDNVALFFAKSLPNNVDDIVANHNVKELTVEMKKGIEELLIATEEYKKVCGLEVYQRVDNLTQVFEIKLDNNTTVKRRAVVYRINKCIYNGTLLLPPNKINDIVAKHNVKALTVEMKEYIQKLLKTSGKSESLCGPKMHQLVENIAKVSELETGLCLARTKVSLKKPTDTFKDLDLCMSRVENKVSLGGRVVVYDLNNCIYNI